MYHVCIYEINRLANMAPINNMFYFALPEIQLHLISFIKMGNMTFFGVM